MSVLGDRDLAIEITFLLAFVVPLSGTTLSGDGLVGGIGLLDTVVLVSLYVLYLGADGMKAC